MTSVSGKARDCHHHIGRAGGDRARAGARAGAAAVLLTLACLLLAACGTNASADGGATDTGARGHLKLGLPF
jgi:hypothetical protein